MHTAFRGLTSGVTPLIRGVRDGNVRAIANPATLRFCLPVADASFSGTGTGLTCICDADERAEVRRDAAAAMVRLGQAAVRPALERATGDPDREVRVYAAKALKRIPGPGTRR